MYNHSRANPVFVRQFSEGQLRPSDWDDPIRALAQASELPLHRFDDARRIFSSYYPRDCRRAWACVDEGHLAARAQHAQALAQFELQFDPLGSDSQCDGALQRITSYLVQGKDGYWLWEALVEDVQSIAKFSADGKERIARWFACAALRAYYPYIRGKCYWDAVMRNYEEHARHVFELIRFEYEYTRDSRDGEELERELRIAQRFASRLREDADRHKCANLLNGPPSIYSSSLVPNAKGVYARFREPDDSLPMYVGMGSLRSAMEKRHKRYSGRHKIYLTWCEDDDCQIMEKKLLAVLDPPENSHRTPRQWIRHPDELQEWFSPP